MPVTKFEYCAVCGSFYPRFFMIFCRMSYSLWYSPYTLAHQWGVRKNRPPLDTSVSYFCRCNDHSKIKKEVESILFSLSLILAIASKVFSLAGLTRELYRDDIFRRLSVKALSFLLVFLGPQKCFASYIHQNVFLLSQKEHVPSAQNPFSQNPLEPILGEVSFIVLRPVFIFCYFGG